MGSLLAQAVGVAPLALADVMDAGVLARADSLGRAYRGARPFPHVVIDNFLHPEIAEDVSRHFPAMEQMPTVFREPMSLKGQLSDIDGKWPRFSPLFDVLQSAEFRGLVGAIAGIPGLLADPMLAGGGLHQSPRSGFLDIHVDANFHPEDKRLHRRVNILIYMNKEWRTEWGGQLELWEDANLKPGRLVASVEPVFNRAVIFSTTRTSWHGVAAIQCPEGLSRRSLALYYYTASRPANELYKDSSVIWMNRSVWWKRAFYPAMNAAIAVLKPYAKRVRTLTGRDRMFDAAGRK